MEIPPSHAALPEHSTPAGLNKLPTWKQGDKDAGIPADPAHGYLVIGGRLYLVASTGPNARPHYASGLVPDGSTRLGLGFTSTNRGHVEASVAALLRKLGRTGVDVSDATLVVNLAPCKHEGLGCRPNMTKMLPEGTRLQVYARNAHDNSVYSHLFLGAPDV